MKVVCGLTFQSYSITLNLLTWAVPRFKVTYLDENMMSLVHSKADHTTRSGKVCKTVDLSIL